MELKIYQMKVFKNKGNDKYTGVVEGPTITEEKKKFFDKVEDYTDYKENVHEDGKGIIYFNDEFNHEGMILSDLLIELVEEDDKTIRKVKEYNIIEEEWTSIYLETGNPIESGRAYKVPVFIKTDKEIYDNAPNKEAFDEGLNSLGLMRISEKQEKDYHDGNVVFQSWPLTFEKYVSNFSKDNESKNYNVIVKTVKNSDGDITFRKVDKIFEPTFLNGAKVINGNVESLEPQEGFTNVEIKYVVPKSDIRDENNKHIGNFATKRVVNEDTIDFYFNVRVVECGVEVGDEVSIELDDTNTTKKKTPIIKIEELKVFNPFA